MTASPPFPAGVARLVDRRPEVHRDRLVADLVPPPRFAEASFSNYLPDPAEPSQAAAVVALQRFGDQLGASRAGSGRWSRLARWDLLRRNPGRQNPGRQNPAGQNPAGQDPDPLGRRQKDGRGPGRKSEKDTGAHLGIYLDGGFGVGKTHLLAALWHAAPSPKSYCTFVELTHLVGALGFGEAVEALTGQRLLCLDEFELDDPGDTMLVSTLLARLVERGVRLAATSNTLPGKLGEGRFAAQDFLREIQALAASFTAVRVDGPDYRHRGLPVPPPPVSDLEVTTRSLATPGATLDDWNELLAHLASLHPSRYGALLDGVRAVHLRGVGTVTDQSVGLRVVVLADRLYDRAIPVVASGVAFGELFAAEALAGGYRKKYLRAISRLSALARDAAVPSA